MGTSTSSGGGKAGSPFDPEWLTNAGDAGDAGAGDGNDGDSSEDSPADAVADGEGADGDTGTEQDADFAPSRRFAEARQRMTAFLGGGGQEAIRGATRSMVNRGMGGPRRAASTMRGTAQGAGGLGQFLQSARDGTDARVTDWVDRVRHANLSADDLILELVQEVMPSTGSIDDESLRNAAADALGQLYEINPGIDLLSLTDVQIHDVMAITIANDVCNRMDLQLGQTYERLRYDPQQIQVYRKDVREYVRGQVRVVMERHSGRGLDPKALGHEVLKSALEVFAS